MATLYPIEALLGKEIGMSKAKFCDRCGKVYCSDHIDRGSDKIPQKIKYGYTCGKGTHYVSLDLCQDCGKSFEDFMDRLYVEPIKDCSHK